MLQSEINITKRTICTMNSKKKIKRSLKESINKHSSNTYCSPGTVLSTRDTKKEPKKSNSE